MWQATRCNFVIIMPKAALPDSQVMLAGFSTGFLNLFSPSADELASTLTKTGLDARDAEDWADLGQGASEAVIPDRLLHISAGVSDDGRDSLPQIATIQRPEDLTRTPPYWMIVREEGKQRVVVQGSHAPSLACLDEYLRRWCRTDATRGDRVSNTSSYLALYH